MPFKPPTIPAEAMQRPKAQAAVKALRERGQITDRQLLVIAMHGDGKTHREIADALGFEGTARLRRTRRIVHRAFALVIHEIRRQEHQARRPAA